MKTNPMQEQLQQIGPSLETKPFEEVLREKVRTLGRESLKKENFPSDLLAELSINPKLKEEFLDVLESLMINDESFQNQPLESLSLDEDYVAEVLRNFLERRHALQEVADKSPEPEKKPQKEIIEIKTLTEEVYGKILDYIVQEKMTEGVGPGKALLLFMKKEGLAFSDLKYSFAAQSALRKKIELMKKQESHKIEVVQEENFRTRIEDSEIHEKILPELRKVAPAKNSTEYKKAVTDALRTYVEKNSIKLPENEFFRLRNDALRFLKKERGPKEDLEKINSATQEINSTIAAIESGEHAAAEVRIPLEDLSEGAQADAISLVQTQNTKNIPAEEAVNLVGQIGRPRLTEGTPSEHTDAPIALGNGLITDQNFLPQTALVERNLGADLPTSEGLTHTETLVDVHLSPALPNAQTESLPGSFEENISANLPTQSESVPTRERVRETRESPAATNTSPTQEAAPPTTPTSLKETFKNEEADRYKGLLEARKASLKKDIEDMKEAMKTVGASGAGYYYKEIDKVKKSLTEIEKKLGRAAEKDSSFKKALVFESFEDLEKSHLTEGEKQKYLEVLTRLNERRATQDASLREKLGDTLLRGTEKYRKLPWYKKVAYGIGIGAVGGALGSMTAATALPVATGLFMRGLGAQSSYLGFKDRFVEKLERKSREEVDESLMEEGDTNYAKAAELQKGTQLALAAIERNTFNKTAALWSGILSLVVPDTIAESLRATGAHIPWTDIQLNKGGLLRQVGLFGASGESVVLPVKSASSIVSPAESLSPGEEAVAEKPSVTQPLSTEKTSSVATVSSREVGDNSSVAKVSVRETGTPQGNSGVAEAVALEKARIASQLTEELKNNGAMLQDWKKMEADFSQKISLAETEKARLLNEMFVKSGNGTPVLDGSGKPVLAGAQSEINTPKITALDKEIQRLSTLRDATRRDIETMSLKNKDLLLKLNPAQSPAASTAVTAVPTEATGAVSQIPGGVKITATPSVGEVDKMTGLRKVPGGLEIPGGSGKNGGVLPIVQNSAPGNSYLAAQTKVLPTAESFGLHVPTTKVVELENKFTSSFVQQMAGMKEAGHPDTVIVQNITPESLRLATLDYVKMHETVLGPVGNPVADALLKTPARIFTIPGNFFRLNPALAQDPTWVRMVSNVENMLSNGKHTLTPGIYGSRLSPQAEFLEQYLVLANMQQRGNLPVGGYQGGVLRTTRG